MKGGTRVDIPIRLFTNTYILAVQVSRMRIACQLLRTYIIDLFAQNFADSTIIILAVYWQSNTVRNANVRQKLYCVYFLEKLHAFAVYEQCLGIVCFPHIFATSLLLVLISKAENTLEEKPAD